uniref:DNA2/NAM7 helicase-like C-terminal domain-containing protein n=1 Tax=Panagrolaimus superbus TaxID=310955 RepID=A0A914Z7R7_9BILA
MPLFTFGNVNTKFAIAGDPKQLDPVIVSSVLRYKSYNSKLSTISRLNDHPEYEEFRKNKRNFVTLNTNYRSQTEICTLVSNIIYENKLISSDPSDCNDFIGCEILKNKEIPIVFWDVNGAEKSVNTSFMNQEEIDQVFQTIENIFKLHEIYISQSDIGVVTPYKANVFGFKKRLEAVYPEITVDSVERYQGSERDVIIISTVRTKKLGFLCDPKRLCTAISRPRKLLVLIGCVPVLIKDPKWKELIEFLHKNNCIFSS